MQSRAVGCKALKLRTECRWVRCKGRNDRVQQPRRQATSCFGCPSLL